MGADRRELNTITVAALTMLLTRTGDVAAHLTQSHLAGATELCRLG